MPWEFASFLEDAEDAASDGVQPVGRPGKVGVLDLSLGVDAASSVQKTGVTSRYVKAPMQFTRPLYIDPLIPGRPSSMSGRPVAGWHRTTGSGSG
ncbi:hypothetical protein CVAR21S_02734 [Corynebacterium variabile]